MERGLYQFDDFQIDTRNRTLTKSGARVSLPPKVFETLLLLVTAAPNAVDRRELRAALWPDVTVEEGVLAQSVYFLRKALGRRPDGEHYIETLPKLGYRFAAEIRTAATPAPPPQPAARDWSRVAAASCVCFVLIVAGIAALPRRHEPVPEAVRLNEYGMAIWKQRRMLLDDERYFRDAVRIDPEYANAHAGLAAALAFHPYPAVEAGAEASRAVALNPNLSFGYAIRGFVEMVHGWNWRSAETDLRRATMLDPRDSTATQWYALFLALQGRTEEGVRLLDTGLERQPDATNLLAEKCDLLYFNRQYERARQACEAGLRISPGFVFAQQRLLYIHAMTEDWDRAVAQIVETYVGGPGGRRAAWEGRFLKALANDGREGFWRQFRELFAAQGSSPFFMAIADAQLNDREAALSEVERAVATHAFHAFFIGAEPALASIHEDPRFQAACRRVGVACN